MKRSANSRCSLVLLCFFLVFCTGARAQKFKYSIPGLDSLDQPFILNGTASTVLRSGQAEIIWNNTLASYWLAYHQNGTNSPILDRFRQTQFLADLYGFYGISGSGRWDIGVQLKYVRTRLDNAASSSMFRVFDGQADPLDETGNDLSSPTPVLDNSLGGLTNIGLRFRFTPIKWHPQLVLNGGYAFSVIKDQTKQALLLADRDMLDLGATYYREINRSTFFFFGGSASVFFPSDVRNEYLFRTSLSYAIVLRTNNNKFNFYPSLAYGMDFKPSQFDRRALVKTIDFLFAYGSVQYVPNQQFNVFLTAGLPLLIDLKNPQLEIVRNSYSILALGSRFGF